MLIRLKDNLDGKCVYVVNDSDEYSRGGVLYASDVLAWLPIEKCSIDIKQICWNPEYHLIGSTKYGFTVYAKDADPCLIVEYTGGDGGVIFFHMDVKTGNCFATNKDDREEIPYIKGGLKDWYEDNKERLIEDYHSGRYSVLPEWKTSDYSFLDETSNGILVFVNILEIMLNQATKLMLY